VVIKQKNLIKGMTIIEMLVAISVICILLLFFFVSYSNVKKAYALFRSAYQIARDIRTVEESAMSAKCLNCQISFNAQNKNCYKILEKEKCLEKGIEIVELLPNSPLNLSFSPPNPDVSINGINTNQEGEVIISDGKRTIKIKVNTVGRIEIE
jgi:prepilin-type N-terminal cleavage/methylation domain-containing protein